MSGKLDSLDWQESAGFASKVCPNDSPAGETLTLLEKQILKLIAGGKSNQEISQLLCMSVRTLYDHHIQIMDKLNFRNPGDLVNYVIQEGYTYREI